MTVDIYAPTANDGLSAEEKALYDLIMAERAKAGLGSIALSKDLTLVAGRHATDSYYNIFKTGLALPEGANLHSWSDAPYYSDHSQPAVMWDAPERLGTDYATAGYEISAAGYTTIEGALAGWLGSPGHRSVILNEGIWEGLDWNAIGVGIEYHGDQRYYHVWFGTSEDEAPDGYSAFGTPLPAEEEVPPSDSGEDESGGPSGSGVTTKDGTTSVSVMGLTVSFETPKPVDLDPITLDFGSLTGGKIKGSPKVDLLFGKKGVDILVGFGGADKLKGGGGGDKLQGGKGKDKLFGQGGSDLLEGGGGKDMLKGGKGGDALKGGTGRDTLFGQGGKDTFFLSKGRDLVKDFKLGQDEIGKLSGKAKMKDVKKGVLILDKGKSMILEGFDKSDLDWSDLG